LRLRRRRLHPAAGRRIDESKNQNKDPHRYTDTHKKTEGSAAAAAAVDIFIGPFAHDPLHARHIHRDKNYFQHSTHACNDRRQNAAASVASVGGSVTSGILNTSKTAPTALHAAATAAGAAAAAAAAATEATSISDQKSMSAKMR
jgi:hypothetical protein